MVNTMEWLSAVLALIAAAGAILLVAARLLAPAVPLAGRLGALVVSQRAALTLAVGLVATLGSLYFSEVANYVPCRLCWFQRIAMYPIALVALIALIRRDRGARWYLAPMAAIGLVISGYHFLIERGVLADSGSCLAVGPSCADIWFEEFGFVTLAFMALAGFAAVLALNTLSFESPEEGS